MEIRNKYLQGRKHVTFSTHNNKFVLNTDKPLQPNWEIKIPQNAIKLVDIITYFCWHIRTMVNFSDVQLDFLNCPNRKQHSST
jgi:hypothetical protein